MKRGRKKIAALSGLFLWGYTHVPLLAHAQDIDLSNPQNMIHDVDQIIVTATRLPLDNLDYAGTVRALSEDDIERISAFHLSEVLNSVAGVGIQRGSGQESLTAIRSPVLNGGAGQGSFLFLEDGVPIRAAGFGNVNALLETGSEFAGGVEVVKGPGSVLYGSNAVHGLVNVLSQAPIDIWGGDARFFSSFNGRGESSSRTFIGSLTGPAPGGAFRLSGSLADDSGFRDESGLDQQKVQLRYDGEWGRWGARFLSTFQNLNQETAGFLEVPDDFVGEPLQDDDLVFGPAFPEAFRDARNFRAQLRLTRDLDNGLSLSLTPYGRIIDLEFLRHFVPGQALEENGHSSVGFLSALNGNGFIAGVDAEYTTGFLREVQDNPTVFGFIEGEHYDYRVESVVVAAYAKKDFYLTDKLTLDIGARAEYTDYIYRNNIDSGDFGIFRRVDDRSDDFFTVTPKVGITYQPTQALTLYGRAARGSRAPQTSDLYSLRINQDIGDIDVETLDSLEAGIKGIWHGFNYDLAAFTQWKDNFFFRNSEGFSVSNGETRHTGVEFSLIGPITDWLSIAADATWARHTYAFSDETFTFAGTTDAPNTITAGDDIDTAPRTLANLRLIATPTDRLSTEFEWRHVGSYFTDPGNTQRYEGHDIFAYRLSYDVNDYISVFGRIDNLFNTRFADRADFAFGNERFFPGRPRTGTIGVSLNY